MEPVLPSIQYKEVEKEESLCTYAHQKTQQTMHKELKTVANVLQMYVQHITHNAKALSKKDPPKTLGTRVG